MRRALKQWPVLLRDTPSDAAREPAVSFVVGHRGMSRLPNLLTTLRSIAGQSGAPVECIVVEQSERPEVREALPSWVRYLHTPVPSGLDYCRSATFNAGAEIARGEVLIAHDNDMLAPYRYASEVLARAREGWDFIDLKRFVFYLPEGTSRALFEGAPLCAETTGEIAQNLKGGSIAATRDVYRVVGGYDEDFVGWGGEDLEFWERARVAGRVYEFGYLPLLHLWHPPQAGKLDHSKAPAMQRYDELRLIPPEERIVRLLGRQQLPRK